MERIHGCILNALCYEGLKKRYPDKTADVCVEDIIEQAKASIVADRKDVVIKRAEDSNDDIPETFLRVVSYLFNGICRLFPDCVGLH